MTHTHTPIVKPPSQEDKWFPLNTCCGCGSTSSGSGASPLIYGPVFVVAKIPITKDTGGKKCINKKLVAV